MSWLFAQFYERFCSKESETMRVARRAVSGDLEGNVIEIGAGTGNNFRYYGSGARVTATDRSPHMLKRAQSRAQQATATITLQEADVQALPFADDSFDHAVSTLVFCSVPDPQRGLAEIMRVTKPGGAVRFLEHIRSDRTWMGRFQTLVTPFWKLIGDGCRLTRDTVAALREAGFAVEAVEAVPGTPAIAPFFMIRARVPLTASAESTADSES